MRRRYALLACPFASADDKAAALPWEMLGKVSLVKQKDRYVPEFPKDLAVRDDAGGLLYRLTDAVAVPK